MLAAVAAALAAGSALAQPKLKFAHVYETSEPYHTAAVWAAGEIAKRTSNRYAMEVFPASSLGKDTDINQGRTRGTVDIIDTGRLFAGRRTGPRSIGRRPFGFRSLDPRERLDVSAPRHRRASLSDGRNAARATR